MYALAAGMGYGWALLFVLAGAPWWLHAISLVSYAATAVAHEMARKRRHGIADALSGAMERTTESLVRKNRRHLN